MELRHAIQHRSVYYPCPGASLLLCRHSDEKSQNWFIGIRTPWTLSSERVWDKTHKIGAKLFKVSDLIAFLGLIAPDYGLFFVFVPVILAAAYLIVYSYFEYQKQTE